MSRDDFLKRDIGLRGKDTGVRRKDGNLQAGKCTGETPYEKMNCDRLGFFTTDPDAKPVPTRIRIMLEQEDKRLTYELREYGVRPQPGTVCWCGSKLTASKRMAPRCLSDDFHDPFTYGADRKD